MPITRPLTPAMSSIPALQGTCNRQELKLTAKLTKLEAKKNSEDEDITEATFEKFNGTSEEIDRELGNAQITEGGSHSAFIKGVETKVSISRSS